MLYIVDNHTNPYWNLAAEEYLFTHFSEPIFRLWRNENSIIVGKYQNTLSEIDLQYVKTNHIKIVRRLTGGGAVFHDLGNINFTFIEDKIKGENTSDMFKRFTSPIINALNSLDVKAYMEGRNDLLIDGRKFSGNAICIHNNRILQHGTLLFKVGMNNLSLALKSKPEKFKDKAVQSNRSRVTNISEHLKSSMFIHNNVIGNNNDSNLSKVAKSIEISTTEFQKYLGSFICEKYSETIKTYKYSSEDLENIDKLVKSKYELDEWNFGKSPKYNFQNSAKYKGGLIELNFSVKQGIITDIKIYGDYFFTLPTEDIYDKLIGVKHTKKDIEKIIATLPINKYFANITPEEIVKLFF